MIREGEEPSLGRFFIPGTALFEVGEKAGTDYLKAIGISDLVNLLKHFQLHLNYPENPGG